MTDDRSNLIDKIKGYNLKETEELAEKIRTDMISYVSKTGGHLASSLGVVELTLAIHKVFNAPEDKIVWDVGHQTYAHKMVTGRWEQMKSLRQLDGLSGFPKISESPYDTSSPGHSGTSLSIACGYAKARDLKGETYSVVAVIGDGSLTSGVAWEALNYIGEAKTPMVIIVNDNEMSISENIGGLARHLQRLRTSGFYGKFKSNIKKRSGEKGIQRLSAIRNAIKYSFLPRNIVEELGFKYYGPINGHDIESLENMLSFAKNLDKPVILHVLTKKGKGFKPAEDDPTRFHGIGKFDPENCDGISDAKTGSISWSDAFGKALLELADIDDRICAITAAMGDSTGLCPMAEKYPSRFFDVGIAEQHAAAYAEGLALAGMKPVAAVYSTFLQRCYDQILTEICLQKLPVIFAVDRAGVTGRDGETHQGIFDIAYLYTMPGMTIMSPRDETTLKKMLVRAFASGRPAAIRYPRGVITEKSYGSGDGTSEIIKQGRDVVILSDANMLDTAINAASVLFEKTGIDAAVADIGILKPLDEIFIRSVLNNYKYVITLEDGIFRGGFGSAVSQFALSNNFDNHILNIGWPDSFIEQGSIEELRQRYEMDPEGIARRIADFKGEQN